MVWRVSVFLLLAALGPVRAAPRWMVRTSTAAVCAAQAFDIATTAVGERQGAREGNAAFRRADGGVKWAGFAPVKAGLCVGAIWIGARYGRRWPAAIAAVDAGLAAATIRAGARNLKVITASPR